MYHKTREHYKRTFSRDQKNTWYRQNLLSQDVIEGNVLKHGTDLQNDHKKNTSLPKQNVDVGQNFTSESKRQQVEQGPIATTKHPDVRQQGSNCSTQPQNSN